MSLHRFLVAPEHLASDELVLQGDELRHLKVRRVEPGEGVIVSDGAGVERAAVVVSVARDRAVLRYTSAAHAAPMPRLRLTLAQSLLKADKLALVVEKATELGVDSIVLLRSARVVGGLSAERLARLRRVVHSAAKQSQRARVPEITGPVALSELIEATPAAERLLFWEESGTALCEVVAAAKSPSHVVVVIGPEGGFSRAEVDAAIGAGCRVVSLGTGILRAETAAIAAVAMCRFAWSD